ARIGNLPNTGEIRGEGLFIGIEFVADAATKEPFPPEVKLNALVKREAMQRGLLVYAMGGTIDGRRGDHVLLAPPFTITDAEIDTVIDRFALSISAAVSLA